MEHGYASAEERSPDAPWVMEMVWEMYVVGLLSDSDTEIPRALHNSAKPSEPLSHVRISLISFARSLP